ncbi:MAG: 50S ribosomal protein L9 [Clostridia bacterium]|nr:50S ribosomal protein L9 [Clostridia bacterium]MBR5383317.1 50S ribosomal protein L9 [Clostridia bacterium]
MKVILLQDVKDIGKKDDIVNVSDGYARNYLFPRKWAMEATENAVRVVERKREAERRREAEARAAAEQTAAKLKNKVVILKAKCGEKGRLYGSVTAQEVADAIQAGYEVEIDKRKVEIKEPVRQLGDYEVTVHLYPNVSTRMLLRVKNIAEG